jgi:hypothetical protein
MARRERGKAVVFKRRKAGAYAYMQNYCVFELKQKISCVGPGTKECKTEE